MHSDYFSGFRNETLSFAATAFVSVKELVRDYANFMGRRIEVLVRFLVALLLFSPVLAQSQGPASATKEVFTADERRRALQIENAVAKEFEDLLKNSGSRSLARVSTSAKYRQILCSASVDGLNSNQAGSGFRWTTTDPTALGPQVRKTVLSPWFVHFLVTAYPARTPNFAAGTYWVEISFRGSPFAEWLENNLTDQALYKNEWKKYIAPQCEHIH